LFNAFSATIFNVSNASFRVVVNVFFTSSNCSPGKRSRGCNLGTFFNKISGSIQGNSEAESEIIK